MRMGHIPDAAVLQLIEEFRIARFFELQDYQSAATDLPVCITEFQVGTIRKRVVDYGFSSSVPDTSDDSRSGAPETLTQLERRIDEIADSKKWVKGPWLRRLLYWR